MDDKQNEKDCNLELESEQNEDTSVQKEEPSERNLNDENSKLINDLKEQLANQKDMFLRTAAEYENYRKRSQREKTAIYNDATASTIETILPVIDSLELALKSSEGASEEYKKGLQLIKNQLDESFKKLGVEEIGKEGDEFDPNYHNAVLHIEDDKVADNTIIEVFQKGYMLSERVIRHAMVKVAN